MVGWSFCADELNSEAPMLSPAASSSDESGCSARSCSMVAANGTVRFLPMRPWKSLKFSRFSVAVPPVVPEAEIPMITGSWSEARN